MITKSKITAALALLFTGLFFFSSCKDDSITPSPATTPLYDTLGWFIQGGAGSVTGQGTKLIADPANSGQEIQAGRLAIRTVVDSAIFVIAADPVLQPYFPTLLAEVGAGNLTGFANLSKNLTDFIQQAVSGQMIYTGKSMVEAHNFKTYSRFGSAENPTADNADFDQFIADVATAAAALKVPGSVIAQLGAILNTTRGSVVQDN